MTQGEIEQSLITMLKELQTGAGEPAYELTPTTVPLKDLGFFDSLLALETTITLEEKLGTSFNADSIFSDKESAEPLSVSQIAARIVKVQGAGV
jgi:acyl carrier protein